MLTSKVQCPQHSAHQPALQAQVAGAAVLRRDQHVADDDVLRLRLLRRAPAKPAQTDLCCDLIAIITSVVRLVRCNLVRVPCSTARRLGSAPHRHALHRLRGVARVGPLPAARRRRRRLVAGRRRLLRGLPVQRGTSRGWATMCSRCRRRRRRSSTSGSGCARVVCSCIRQLHMAPSGMHSGCRHVQCDRISDRVSHAC